MTDYYNLNGELFQCIPQPNSSEIVFVEIKCMLEKAGVVLLSSNIDGTIIIDKEVPKNTEQDIIKFAKARKYDIKFIISEKSASKTGFPPARE